MFNPYSLYDIGKLSGNDSGDFPETFSKIYDFKWNFVNSFFLLKKVSGKASESWPELSITDKGPDFVQSLDFLDQYYQRPSTSNEFIISKPWVISTNNRIKKLLSRKKMLKNVLQNFVIVWQNCANVWQNIVNCQIF